MSFIFGRWLSAAFVVGALLHSVVGNLAIAQSDGVAAARGLLPADIKQRGVLKAAMPLDFEPYNFLDDKNEQVGFDVEIFRAVADVLGVKPEIERLGFASIIPAVSGGRVDVGMSVMGILEARRKQVSFTRYTLLANGLIVRKGNPSGIKNSDACGHSIAVEKGTQPVFVWQEISKKCEESGKAAIQLSIFDGKGPQVLAVEAGRAEAAGVVRREPDPADRRALQVALTDEGVELLRRFGFKRVAAAAGVSEYELALGAAA